MEKKTGSHLLVDALRQEGVEHVFTVAGDHTLPILDVLADTNIKLWDTRHEAAAIHMGEGYARSSGKPAVCLHTTAGHANAIAGLAHALHGEAVVSKNTNDGAVEWQHGFGATIVVISSDDRRWLGSSSSTDRHRIPSGREPFAQGAAARPSNPLHRC